MITVKTFDNPVQAHLLKSKLQSEGIPAFLFDENIVTLNPLYNNLVGGIKVRVSDTDADRATALIKVIEMKDLTDEQGEVVRCPRCNSSAFYDGFKSIRNLKGILSFVLSLLLVVYPLYYKTVKKCKKCDLEFG